MRRCARALRSRFPLGRCSDDRPIPRDVRTPFYRSTDKNKQKLYKISFANDILQFFSTPIELDRVPGPVSTRRIRRKQLVVYRSSSPNTVRLKEHRQTKTKTCNVSAETFNTSREFESCNFYCKRTVPNICLSKRNRRDKSIPRSRSARVGHQKIFGRRSYIQ